MSGIAKMLIQKISQLLSTLRDGFRSILPIIILIIYTVIGALLFSYLEGPNELYTLNTLKKTREDLIENTAFRLNNIRAMTPINAYNHTVNTLHRFQEKLGIEEVPEENQQWTFLGAIFYCMTVYTTIGYGNIVPVTTAGRVLTILYAFIGIPLAVICLFGLGSLFAKICKILWKMIVKSTAVVSKDLEKKMTNMGPEAGATSKSEESGNDDNDLLSFPISFLVLLTVIWIFVCAGIFMLLEDKWDYGTSMYFTLISFTTIGFGDELPSEYDYMIVVGFLLLIGLALVSTVMTLIQQQLEALAQGMQDNIDKEYMTALAEAQDEGEVPEAAPVTEGEEQIEGEAPLDPRSLDAVVSRMPLKSRLLYHVMPESSKKQLQKHSEQKMSVKSRSCQTDLELLREYALEKFKEDFKAVNVVVVQDFSGQETPSTTVFHGDVTAHQSQKTPSVTYPQPRKVDIHVHPQTSKESHGIPVQLRTEARPGPSREEGTPQRAEFVHARESESEEESEEYTPAKRTTTLIIPQKKDVRDTDV